MKFRIIYDGRLYRVEIMYPGGKTWVMDSEHQSYDQAIRYAFQRNNWQPLVCSELQTA